VTDVDRCIAEQARCAAEYLKRDGADKIGAAQGVADWAAEEVLVRLEETQ